MRIFAGILLVLASLAASAETLEDAKKSEDCGDYASAIRIAKPMADAGDPNALSSMGYLYALCRGVPKDFSIAYNYWKRSADKGNPEAMYAIAVLLESGDGGLPKNKDEAVKYYVRSAENGYVHGMIAASTIYAEGISVDQDYKRAFAWLGLAERSTKNFSLKNTIAVHRSGITAEMSKEDAYGASAVINELKIKVETNQQKYKVSQTK